MRAGLRLAGFAALLAAVFAVSALAGGAVDPDTEADAGQAAMGDAHAGTDAAADAGGSTAGGHSEPAEGGRGTDGGGASVKGLAVTDQGYTLELAEDRLPGRGSTELRFRILERDGRPLERYAVEHERRMHLIVVRRDNTGFQHLHPARRDDGTWVSRIRFPQPGSYRVFADFRTGDTPVTLGADLTVDGPARHRALPEPAQVADAGGGYAVRLDAGRARAGQESLLRFTVTRDGHAVHTEPYLGAGGHLVALRDGDLAFLHTHPADHGHDGGGEGAQEAEHDDSVPFETSFPTPGRYRLYLQFKVDGEVHTAAFTQEVTR